MADGRRRNPTERPTIIARTLTIGLTALLCFILISSGGYTNLRSSAAPGDVGKNSRLRTAGWLNNLSADERSYCLHPFGANQSVNITQSDTIVVTNPTENTTGACSATVPHFGLVIADYLNASLLQAWFTTDNNTTNTAGGSLLVSQTMTYYMNYIPVYGTLQTGEGWTEEWLNFTPSSHSIHIFYFVIVPGGGDSSGSITGNGSTASGGSGNCPVGGSSPQVYVWDGVCFDKNYPVVYPHPDRAYYGIYPTLNAYVLGTALLHYQFGSIFVTTLGQLTPIVIGMAIGAAIGWIAGGPYGALVGAVIGAAVTAVVSYFFRVQYSDESSAIWAWVNLGFLSATQSLPWWYQWSATFAPAMYAAYVLGQLSALRIGNTWFINRSGISGP